MIAGAAAVRLKMIFAAVVAWPTLPLSKFVLKKFRLWGPPRRGRNDPAFRMFDACASREPRSLRSHAENFAKTG